MRKSGDGAEDYEDLGDGYFTFCFEGKKILVKTEGTMGYGRNNGKTVAMVVLGNCSK